jgi:phospholipase/carboxylesterase
MHAPIYAICLSIVCASAACDAHDDSVNQAQKPSTAETSSAQFPKKIRAGDLDLLEVLTAGAHETDTLPMIVAVHGMGDRPENWVASFANFPIPARVFLPRAPAPYGNGFSWFTYPSTSHEEFAKGVALAGARVAQAIRELTTKHPTRGKPIVTGFSQGGFVSFDLAVHHPDVIDAAFPMSGGLPAELWPTDEAAAKACAPIFAMHGDADPVVPIQLSRATVGKIAALGGHAKLEEFPGVVHTVTNAERAEMQQRIATRAIAGTGGTE